MQKRRKAAILQQDAGGKVMVSAGAKRPGVRQSPGALGGRLRQPERLLHFLHHQHFNGQIGGNEFQPDLVKFINYHPSAC